MFWEHQGEAMLRWSGVDYTCQAKRRQVSSIDDPPQSTIEIECQSLPRAGAPCACGDSTAWISLQQRAGAWLPSLAFVFCGGGDVLHVGAGLSQDVVQVVAEADEGEAFVEEFADARGAEQEQAQDDVVLAGFGDQLVGGGASSGEVYMSGNLYFS